MEQVAPAHSVFDYSRHFLELCLPGESACLMLANRHLFWKLHYGAGVDRGQVCPASALRVGTAAPVTRLYGG